MDKNEAARQLYLEFRNPLVHELGKDTPSSARPARFLEPIIGKWGAIPQDNQNIDYIDGLTEWNDQWPTMSVQAVGTDSRIKLSSSALYWSVKRMVTDLAVGVADIQ
jgi:hypothetical protein